MTQRNSAEHATPAEPAKTIATPPDWTHITETITMLYLSVCQIETSMSDSSRSVQELVDSFTILADHSKTVDAHVQALSSLEDLDKVQQEVKDTTFEMQQKINRAVTAFQFYDRISQRLDHIARGLEQVTRVLNNNSQRNDKSAWIAVQDRVKSSYSMEAERLMFEHILRGASVEEALEIYHHNFDNLKNDEIDEDGDEIELF